MISNVKVKSRMDSKIKQKWCKALRNKTYEQCTTHLRTKLKRGKYSYCCLGVLLDVTKTVDWAKHDTGFDGYSGYDQLAKLGLAEQQQNALMLLNDGELEWDNLGFTSRVGAKSFPEIADYIEENL